MVDFDELFEKYFEKWYAKNAGKYMPEQVEMMMPDIYGKWLTAFHAEINCAPKDYFSAYGTAELLDMIRSDIKNGKSVSDLVTDAITEKGDDAAVFSALKSAESEGERALLIGVLSAMGSKLPLELYSYWVRTGDVEPEIREHAAEVLKDYAAEVVGSLMKDAFDLDSQTQLLIADIVCTQSGNEAVYKLLTGIFIEGENIELASAYLAKFGDERAIPMLKEYIERPDINYVEFIEVRNAIEALGGEVEERRDFSEDYYYNLIKGAAAEK